MESQTVSSKPRADLVRRLRAHAQIEDEGHSIDLQCAANEIEGLAKDLETLQRSATAFGTRVLEGDTYGCMNGPSRCLHAEARNFLQEVTGR